eukprot:725485-Amphidinium_carterae.1
MTDEAWTSAATVKRAVSKMTTGTMPTVAQPTVVGQIVWDVDKLETMKIDVKKTSTGGYTMGTLTTTSTGARVYTHTPKVAEVNSDALVLDRTQSWLAGCNLVDLVYKGDPALGELVVQIDTPGSLTPELLATAAVKTAFSWAKDLFEGDGAPLRTASDAKETVASLVEILTYTMLSGPVHAAYAVDIAIDTTAESTITEATAMWHDGPTVQEILSMVQWKLASHTSLLTFAGSLNALKTRHHFLSEGSKIAATMSTLLSIAAVPLTRIGGEGQSHKGRIPPGRRWDEWKCDCGNHPRHG